MSDVLEYINVSSPVLYFFYLRCGVQIGCSCRLSLFQEVGTYKGVNKDLWTMVISSLLFAFLFWGCQFPFVPREEFLYHSGVLVLVDDHGACVRLISSFLCPSFPMQMLEFCRTVKPDLSNYDSDGVSSVPPRPFSSFPFSTFSDTIFLVAS